MVLLSMKTTSPYLKNKEHLTGSQILKINK